MPDMSEGVSVIDRLLTTVDRLARWLAYGAGVGLVALTLLTVADVALRYLFNAPIFGAQDISELGLAAVVFGALAYCGRSGGHVAVDLLAERLGAGFVRWSDGFVRIAGAAVFALLAWRAWLAGLDAGEFSEASNLLAIPYQPFYAVIALGAALYALILFLEALAGLRDRSGGTGGA